MSNTTTVSNSPALVSLASQVAKGLDIPIEGKELIDTLKATAFKVKEGDQPVSDSQMMALLVIAKQYHLNPWTKEIYAFPDKGGITPIVGVDGWSRIINEHPQFDGIEFRFSENMVQMEGANSLAHEWIEAVIYRKDRKQPTVIREYIDEVYKPPFKGKYGEVKSPWQTHPKRFHRHKSLIQCARVAFGFGGIYDEDEADRIREAKDITPQATTTVRNEPQPYPLADYEKNKATWKKAIETGKKTPNALIATIETKGFLTNEQKLEIASWQPIEAAYTVQGESVVQGASVDTETGEILDGQN